MSLLTEEQRKELQEAGIKTAYVNETCIGCSACVAISPEVVDPVQSRVPKEELLVEAPTSMSPFGLKSVTAYTQKEIVQVWPITRGELSSIAIWSVVSFANPTDLIPSGKVFPEKQPVGACRISHSPNPKLSAEADSPKALTFGRELLV